MFDPVACTVRHSFAVHVGAGIAAARATAAGFALDPVDTDGVGTRIERASVAGDAVAETDDGVCPTSVTSTRATSYGVRSRLKMPPDAH